MIGVLLIGSLLGMTLCYLIGWNEGRALERSKAYIYRAALERIERGGEDGFELARLAAYALRGAQAEEEGRPYDYAEDGL